MTSRSKPASRPPDRPIFLTGMPGSGKTTTGKILARLLDVDFVDLDRLYQSVRKVSPAQDIRRGGETAFRRTERAVLEHYLSRRRRAVVIACGGGTLANEAGLSRALGRGVVVYLAAKVETLAARLQDASNHPLLEGADLAANLADLLARRRGFYEASHVRVDTDCLSPWTAALAVREQVADFRPAGYLWHWYPPRFSRIAGGQEAFLELGHAVCPIRVCEQSWIDELPGFLDEIVPGRQLAVMVDRDVLRLYRGELREALAGRRAVWIPLPAGEKAKELDRLQSYVEALRGKGITRGGAVLAVGGGSTLDAAGFTAAVYMRGIPVVNVPTTFLAAVDAGVGGKSAMDTPGGKNLAGLFRQPAGVLVPLDLVAREMNLRRAFDGWSEYFKTCLLLGNRKLPAPWSRPPALARTTDLRTLVTTCLLYKMSLVSLDEREETGERTLLNLGHTFAHVIEAASGYRIPHGRAVGWGLVIAARASVRLGLAKQDFCDLVERNASGLRLWPPPGNFRLRERDVRHLLADKKRSGDRIRLVLLKDFGRPVVASVPIRVVENLMLASL